MYLDIELTNEELKRLDEGGFITLILPPGIRVIVKKDDSKEVSG